ncbi:MAG: hypothetical protein GYA35_02285, partial [Thermoanaerobaculaceae bacterium]|nr:hypothetical protein [Thermoanaerobaculaceae bacterium]
MRQKLVLDFKTYFVKFLLVVIVLALAFATGAEEKKIAKITLEGADRITQEAFLALTSLRPNQIYDDETVKREFKRIWDSGLFEDLS